MRDRVVARLVAAVRRLRRFERREAATVRRWLERTSNLLHLTVVVAVPLLIALVTLISNALAELSFLLFPPLASGAYTLFSDPEGRYASPRKFVVGLTVGALCGWAALWATAGNGILVSPRSAALSIFLTGVATWVLDVEEPAAFSTALLVLVTDDASPEAYVGSVAVFGTIVALTFAVWRNRFYERRARYLYGTVRGDDHVLVPIRADDEGATRTALFGARLAAAHEAGKVVLLGLVGADETPDADDAEGASDAVATAVSAVERRAEAVRAAAAVPCEAVVASGPPVAATLRAAADTNCDLLVAPYGETDGPVPSFVRGLFESRYDVVAFQASARSGPWRRVLVTVGPTGDVAHAMLDFAARAVDEDGVLSVCTCIDAEVERRPAEKRLADLVETVDADVETRVARSDVTAFIDANAASYDLLVLGSSGDRSRASRLVSPPTVERLREVDCDVAVVDGGRP
jgi:nucleotide-binding universal stress UspA family protein